MVIDRAITMFSRESRRRMEQARRTGRGFSAPGPGQPRRSGGCCIFLIILVVAIVVYAYVESYWLAPERERQKQQEREDTSSRPVITARAPAAESDPAAVYFL